MRAFRITPAPLGLQQCRPSVTFSRLAPQFRRYGNSIVASQLMPAYITGKLRKIVIAVLTFKS